MEITGLLIAALLVALFTVVTVMRAARSVPQARARKVERLGRYHRTAAARTELRHPLHRPRPTHDRPR